MLGQKAMSTANRLQFYTPSAPSDNKSLINSNNQDVAIPPSLIPTSSFLATTASSLMNRWQGRSLATPTRKASNFLPWMSAAILGKIFSIFVKIIIQNTIQISKNVKIASYILL